MIDSAPALRNDEHAEHQQLMAAFLANPANEVEYLPPGQCNWDSLSNRAKVNPQVRAEERVAKRAQQVVVPAPIENRRKAGRPRRATPKPPKQQRKPQVYEAWGKKSREALAALAERPMTARELADLKGWSGPVTQQRLRSLEEQGRVKRTGSKPNTLWSPAK